jgi:hypothetical protein
MAAPEDAFENYEELDGFLCHNFDDSDESDFEWFDLDDVLRNADIIHTVSID